MKVRRWLDGNGYMVFLLSMILYLASIPILGQGKHGYAMDLALAFMIWAGAWAIHRKRTLAILVLVLGVASLLSPRIGLFPPLQEMTVLRLALRVIALLLISGAIVMDIWKAKRITRDLLFAAGCLYVLFGALWGDVYAGLELLYPGSFDMVGGVGVRGEEALILEMLYYSYVTLTTLGYGDITPVSSFAKMGALLEAVMGQLFLVIMVARLVGLQIAHSQRDWDDPE